MMGDLCTLYGQHEKAEVLREAASLPLGPCPATLVSLKLLLRADTSSEFGCVPINPLAPSHLNRSRIHGTVAVTCW
jgi:hypothetical protein